MKIQEGASASSYLDAVATAINNASNIFLVKVIIFLRVINM